MKIFSGDAIKGYTNTIGERSEVDNVLALPIFVQNILGQNILNPKWTWIATMGQQITLVLLLIYVIFGTKEYMKGVTDIASKGEAYFTILIMIFFIIKYFLLIKQRDTFQKLYLTTKTSILEILRGDSNEKLIELLTRIKLTVKIFFLASIFPIAMYLLFALWNYILGARVTLSKTTSILMPMTSPYYEIGLVLHTIFMFTMSFSICIVDLWFIIYMFAYYKTTDSITDSLKMTKKTFEETELEYADQLNHALRIFYKHHQILMEFLNLLTDGFKWIIMVPLLGMLAAFCLVTISMREGIQFTLVSNLIPGVIELFAYNYLGEKVTDKAAELYMALLEFDWLSMRLKDKKNYLIIISYMNKEFKIKSAFGTDLSLVTMTSVVKASYQACAVLRTMEE